MPGIEKYITEKREEIPTATCSPQKRRTFVARLLRYWLDHHPNEAARIVVAFVDRGGRPVELIGDKIYGHIVSNALTFELQVGLHTANSDTQTRHRHRERAGNASRLYGAARRLVYRSD